MPLREAPCVSVIMPAHDGVAVKYFDRAVKSIVSQSIEDMELLILLDGVRSQNLADAAKTWEQNDDRIRLVASPSQRGIAQSLNTLIVHARGEFVARMDADDVSLEGRLKAQVEFLRQHPEVTIVGTWATEVDNEGNILFEKRMPTEQTQSQNSWPSGTRSSIQP